MRGKGGFSPKEQWASSKKASPTNSQKRNSREGVKGEVLEERTEGKLPGENNVSNPTHDGWSTGNGEAKNEPPSKSGIDWKKRNKHCKMGKSDGRSSIGEPKS